MKINDVEIPGINLKDKNAAISIDGTFAGDRIRGEIPMSVIAQLLNGGRVKDQSNLAVGQKAIRFKEFAPRYLELRKTEKKNTTYQGDFI